MRARWAENNYWQYFCGEEYFQPRLPCDPTNLGRFRQVLGEAGVEELLATTIAAAANMKMVEPAEFEAVIVDTTVQENAVAFPTDSRLLEMTRAKLVKLAQRAGLMLKQTYEREGKILRRRAVAPAATRTRSSISGCAVSSSDSAPCSAGCCATSSARWRRPLKCIKRR